MYIVKYWKFKQPLELYRYTMCHNYNNHTASYWMYTQLEKAKLCLLVWHLYIYILWPLQPNDKLTFTCIKLGVNTFHLHVDQKMKYKKPAHNIHSLDKKWVYGNKKVKKNWIRKKAGILRRIPYGKAREGWWNSYGLFVSTTTATTKATTTRTERTTMTMVSRRLDNLYRLAMVLLTAFMLSRYCCVWNNVIDR